jgi:Lrp/AsnC family leucine-responsive transcriptional regulator
MIKLDVKDRELLYEIDLDARLGTSELGKRIGMSQEGTFYRLKRLEKLNVISGYMTLINFGKIGYTGYAVYAKFQNVTREEKKNVIEELKQNDHIYWIAEFGGNFDITFAIMAKNIVHFNEIFTEISNKYNNVLKDFKVAIRVELVQFPRDYLIEKGTSKKKTPRFGKFIELEKLDKLDELILKEMAKNARISSIQLSKRIKKPISTVTSRLKKLKKKGIIQGYSAQIRSQEFGYQSYQLFINTRNMTKERQKDFFAYCKSHPNIIFYIETVGKWNFEIIYEIEDQKRLQELIIDIRTKFSDIIFDVESIVLFDHYVKYNQYPFV